MTTFCFSAEKRQTMLFSATSTKKTEDLIKLALKKEPMYVGIDESWKQLVIMNFITQFLQQIIKVAKY